MKRRKLMITSGAILAVGMALAAQRTATQADRPGTEARRHQRWAPGANRPMASYEMAELPLAPPR